MVRSRYEPKKPPDAWEAFDDLLCRSDAATCDAWKDEIEKLLVLAGLACAVVTPFAIESYRELKEDPQEASVKLLSQLVRIARAAANDTSNEEVDVYLGSPLLLAGSSVRINIFWFLSITLNIATVFVGTICLQWIREYTNRDDNIPAKESTALRQMRHEGLVYWKVSSIVSALPLFLQTSLILFFFGLVEFLWPMNGTVATVITLFVLLLCAFFFITTVTPTLQTLFLSNEYLWTPQCPYKSPQSWLFHHLAVASLSMVPSFYNLGHKIRGSQVPTALLNRFTGVRSWLEYDLHWRELRDSFPLDSMGKPLSSGQQAAQRTDGIDTSRGLASLIQHRKGYNAYSITHHCLQDLETSTAAQVLQSLGAKNDVCFPEDASHVMKRHFASFQILDFVFQHNERIRPSLLPFRLELFLELVKEPQFAQLVTQSVDMADVECDKSLPLDMKLEILGYLADRYRSAPSTYTLSSEMVLGVSILSALDISSVRGQWKTFKPVADFALVFYLWSREYPPLASLVTSTRQNFRPHLAFYSMFCEGVSSRNTIYSLQLLQHASKSSNDPFELLCCLINDLETRELQSMFQIINDSGSPQKHKLALAIDPAHIRNYLLFEIVTQALTIAPNLQSYFLLQVELYTELSAHLGSNSRVPWPIRSDEDLRFLLSYGAVDPFRGLLDSVLTKMHQGSLLEQEWSTFLFSIHLLSPGVVTKVVRPLLAWPAALARNTSTSAPTSDPSTALRKRILSVLDELGWNQTFPIPEIIDEIQPGNQSNTSIMDRFSFIFDTFEVDDLLELLTVLYSPNNSELEPHTSHELQPFQDADSQKASFKDVLTSISLLTSYFMDSPTFLCKFPGTAHMFFPHRLRMYLQIMSTIPGVYFRSILQPPWRGSRLGRHYQGIFIPEDIVCQCLALIPWSTSESSVSGLTRGSKDRQDRDFAWSLVYSALQDENHSSHLLHTATSYLEAFCKAVSHCRTDHDHDHYDPGFACDVIHIRFLLRISTSLYLGHTKLFQSQPMKDILKHIPFANIIGSRNDDLHEEESVAWDMLLRTIKSG